MSKGFLTLVLMMAMVSCASSSYEPFVVREKAEYGDTYIFNLDLSDSTVSYRLDFYTRLERPAFGTFPADSISLDLRWISPSDSLICRTLHSSGLPSRWTHRTIRGIL